METPFLCYFGSVNVPHRQEKGSELAQESVHDRSQRPGCISQFSLREPE